jgi:hypothetical protein
MWMKSERQASVGDVFQIPLPDLKRFAIGQIVAAYGKEVFFLAVFEGDYADGAEVDIDRNVNRPVVLLGLSFPAKISSGSWKVLANVKVRADMPLPAYKEFVGTTQNVVVVDYSGLRRRPALPTEIGILPNREVVAPVRLERAFNALIGHAEWNGAWDSLIPKPATTSQLMFPNDELR